PPCGPAGRWPPVALIRRRRHGPARPAPPGCPAAGRPPCGRERPRPRGRRRPAPPPGRGPAGGRRPPGPWDRGSASRGGCETGRGGSSRPSARIPHFAGPPPRAYTGLGYDRSLPKEACPMSLRLALCAALLVTPAALPGADRRPITETDLFRFV